MREKPNTRREKEEETDTILASSAHFVGLPHGGKAQRHPEGPRYNFQYNRHTLDIFLDSPTPEEVQAFRTTPCRMGFWMDAPVLWIIFRLEGMEWADAPYTPYLVEPEGRTFPALEDENSRCPLVMTMNDALDGTIQAIPAHHDVAGDDQKHPSGGASHAGAARGPGPLSSQGCGDIPAVSLHSRHGGKRRHGGASGNLEPENTSGETNEIRPKLKPRWDLHLIGDDDQLGCAGESLSSVLGE